MQIFISYRDDNIISEFSPSSIVQNMPKLEKCAFMNVYLSKFLIEKLCETQLNEIYLCDIDFHVSIEKLFMKDSLKTIYVTYDSIHYDFNNSIFMHYVFSAFHTQNNNIKDFNFSLTTPDYFIPFENILNLINLRNFSFSASIRNSGLYSNLVRIFFLIPFINPSCKITFFLKYPENNFDEHTLFGSTSLRKFVIFYALELQKNHSNFKFFIAM